MEYEIKWKETPRNEHKDKGIRSNEKLSFRDLASLMGSDKGGLTKNNGSSWCKKSNTFIK